MMCGLLYFSGGVAFGDTLRMSPEWESCGWGWMAEAAGAVGA